MAAFARIRMVMLSGVACSILAACGADGVASPGEGVIVVPAPTPTPVTTGACRTVTFEDAQFTHCVAEPARHRITTMLGNPPYRSFKAYAAARA